MACAMNDSMMCAWLNTLPIPSLPVGAIWEATP